MIRFTLLGLLGLVASAWAQPAPPPAAPLSPKRIPIAGITLTATERAELTLGAAALRTELDRLARELAADAKHSALLPDVEIFHKAVDWALRYNEFMAPKEIAVARNYLARGRERAAQLHQRQAPWLDATGLVLRGYRSKIDGSIQPFGLVVPESPPRTGSTPLLVWLLGRGEKRTELAFLSEREASPPQLTPRDTLILVPYGRFCNATKFAGEADVFEALAAVTEHYKVDEDRIAVGGFSMGGRSAWHLATHFPGLWCAASPGAGFAETPIFTSALSPGRESRAPWEQTLWRQYEATGIAGNLFNVPTLAYAGELDGQKQASDLMEAAMAAAGLKLERFIGPQTAHKYHDATKAALTSRFDELIAKGRERVPREIRFSTYPLRYAESAWLRIDGMDQHWERADVKARLSGENAVSIETKNVRALTLDLSPRTISIDGQTVPVVRSPNNRVHLRIHDGTWRTAVIEPAELLRKRPVDDAEGYGNNALQTPKLPDWSIMDLRTPPGPRWPGKVVKAGFFDENWK